MGKITHRKVAFWGTPPAIQEGSPTHQCATSTQEAGEKITVRIVAATLRRHRLNRRDRGMAR
ncbi:MAG: hypothetical protein ACLQVG_16030 [Terriglobia bacterium]